jgi:predicted Zn-dependent protease
VILTPKSSGPILRSLLCLSLATAAAAQSAGPTLPQAIDLAAKGQCRAALPALKRLRPADKQLRYRAGLAEARCAMSLGDAATAVTTLLALQRDFPHDPEVLYMSTHYFSELGGRAAQELATSAPASPQTQKLNAEALESQGKWADAIAVYRRILEQDANAPDIHYRIGRIMLDPAYGAATPDEARAELEAELKVNPTNAAAEFMLGEIQRRAGNFDDAVQHFAAAAKMDAGFSEAYLAQGMSLNASQKFAAAVAPLEAYVKMQPEDPAGHYQLAMAYARTGNRAGAARESELQRKAAEKAPPVSH